MKALIRHALVILIFVSSALLFHSAFGQNWVERQLSGSKNPKMVIDIATEWQQPQQPNVATIELDIEKKLLYVVHYPNVQGGLWHAEVLDSMTSDYQNVSAYAGKLF